MLERFQNMSNAWRLTIFFGFAIILVIGIAFATFNSDSAEDEPNGNGLNTIEPTPTTPTTPPVTPDPEPTEEPVEPPVEEPTNDYPIDLNNNLEVVPKAETIPLSDEEFDQVNMVVIEGVTNLYRIYSNESTDDRRARLQQWIDLDSPRMLDVVEWSQLGGLGFEGGGTIGSVDYIGGTEEDTRFNIGLSTYTTNPAAGDDSNFAINEEYNVYQVALHKVDGVWKIWAVEED